MPVQKIKSGRIITVQASTYVGEKGTVFYDEDTPELRLSDGVTPGGLSFSTASGGTYVLPIASTSTLGGVKIGQNLSIGPDGVLNANTSTAGIADTFKTIKVDGQSDLVASTNDIIKFVAGSGIIIATSATSTPYKTLTITLDGIPSLDGGAPNSVYD